MTLLFPHDTVRNIQDKLIKYISACVEHKKNLIAHAPTGLGKTAASIAPALTHAIDKKNIVIFFLTSRNTQHRLALETLSQIKKKHPVNFIGVDIIGKKSFCIQPNVRRLKSFEFYEYCRKMKEDGLCDYFMNIKKKDKLSPETEELLRQLRKNNPMPTEEVVAVSQEKNLCPYEISALLAKEAKVIIADYYYIFHPRIRAAFFKRLNLELENVLLIVDEAHNLPSRVKELASEKLTSVMISRALNEAKKNGYSDLMDPLEKIGYILKGYGARCDDEMHVSLEDFKEKVNAIREYDELISDLSFAGDVIREKQQYSYIGSIAAFLDLWPGPDEGYTRILEKKRGVDVILSLKYQCLDPSVVTREIINNTYCSILMSGTLTPTPMYKELLGFEDCEEIVLPSPFPDINRLNLIIPETSTKYEHRSPEQYKKIAKVLSNVIETVPGNTAVFFPSYALKDDISKHIVTKKVSLSEEQTLTKQEKETILNKFKSYKDKGAVLLGVISGNFGEGIDLPGDYLKGVVIVGLPLQRPSLETKALIDYFDKKFGKGWDYGYLFPAFTKAIQSAGRCIRSETDKGIVVFLDERYTW
ncbi:MAG: ATP-dependent DNA helicase, partial [Nanoarchaeota archaeon]|nr:ATP-dependent DNA helicase [Nanoarchaeota archaeon]